jgi:hypothetical protein
LAPNAVNRAQHFLGTMGLSFDPQKYAAFSVPGFFFDGRNGE